MWTNPYQHVIDWLESDEGEHWVKRTHHVSANAMFLVSIKRDNDKGWPESILWWFEPEPSMLTNND